MERLRWYAKSGVRQDGMTVWDFWRRRNGMERLLRAPPERLKRLEHHRKRCVDHSAHPPAGGLQWHPDKNPNNPQAAAHFIQITKAYAALTDEAAKANYEKYGNPDGPATMKVGRATIAQTWSVCDAIVNFSWQPTW